MFKTAACLQAASMLVACQGHISPNSNVQGYVTNGESVLWPDGMARVCWENGSEATAEYESLVKSAVIEQYNGRTIVKFLGWDRCAPDSQGIRIRIVETVPLVREYGRYLDGLAGGLQLNFTFELQYSGNSLCSTSEDFRKICIRDYALHEFGHAIGLRHENSRPGSACANDVFQGAGEPGAIVVGEYDPFSIMNYCMNQENVELGRRSALSEGDVATINEYYGGQFQFDGSDQAVQCQTGGGRWRSGIHCCFNPSIVDPTSVSYRLCLDETSHHTR